MDSSSEPRGQSIALRVDCGSIIDGSIGPIKMVINAATQIKISNHERGSRIEAHKLWIFCAIDDVGQ